MSTFWDILYSLLILAIPSDVFGNYWTACSKKKIAVGEKVKVINIEGVKLIVEKEDK